MTSSLTAPTTIRLDDQPLPALVDDLLDDVDRASGAVLVLVADPQLAVAVPIVIDEVPPQAGRDELARFVTTLADIACHASPSGGLALGVGLPRQPRPGEREWWDRTVTAACQEAGLTFRGVVLAPVTAGHAQVAATRR